VRLRRALSRSRCFHETHDVSCKGRGLGIALRSLTFTFSVLLASCFGALAQTGAIQTPTYLNNEVNTLWQDDANGAITPFDARQTLLDLIASSLNVAPSNGIISGSTPITGGTSGQCLYDNAGVIATQACGGSSSLVIPTSPISGGTSGYILYNNGGFLGNLATTGSGNVALSISPVFTTPVLGAATVTSINGLTISPSTGTLNIPNGVAAEFTGGFNVTLNATGNTSVTFPTSGTLATTAQIPSLPLSVANGGTACSTASGTCLDNITGFASTGLVERTGAGAYSFIALPLPLADGGTAANLTASNGGIVYSTASAFAVLAGTGTASQCLLSGANAAPSWGSCSGAAAVSSVSNSDSSLTISPTTGAVVASLNPAHANTWSGAQTFDNGDFLLAGSSSGAMTLEAPAVASSYVITFPAATDTVVTLAATQSLSNKTLAGATISGTANFTGTFEIAGNAMTFPGSAATLASLTTVDQTLSGGANITAYAYGSLTGGTTTFDCGKNPGQYLINASGSNVFAPPSNDGECVIFLVNGSSPTNAMAFAGSGWQVITPYTSFTTNANSIWAVSVIRINGTATYTVVAVK
jgi:hypothetical protein